MEDEIAPKRSRMRWVLYSALGIVIVLPLIGLVAWTQRRPIARNVIDDYLADHGVKARYDIVDIGTERQRIENISIGDPNRPDLTIKWAEIDVKTALFGVAVTAVRASGVRVRGQLVDGKLKLGALDKFIPASTGATFKFPDLDLGLEDVRTSIVTPYGLVGARVDGKGNLSNNFGGQVAIVSPNLAGKSCKLRGVTAFGSFKILAGSPSFSGPVRVADADCVGTTGRNIDVTIASNADSEFDLWSSNIKFGAREIRIANVIATAITGDANLNYAVSRQEWRGYTTFKSNAASWPRSHAIGVKSHFDFLGRTASTRGTYTLDITQLAVPHAQSKASYAMGDYDAGFDTNGRLRLNSTGRLGSRSVVPDEGLARRLADVGRSTIRTPVAPLGDALGKDLARLSSGGTFNTRYDLDQSSGRFRLAIFDVKANSQSGVRFVMNGVTPITYTSSDGFKLAGTAQLSGGGLPTSIVRMESRGSNISGVATISPYQAGQARLAVTPVAFAYGRGGLDLTTNVTVDGVYSGALVQGLHLPINIHGGQIAYAGCRSISFARVALFGMDVLPAQLDVCVDKGGAVINSPRLAGRYGGKSFRAAANGARFGFGNGTFSVNRGSIDYGDSKIASAEFAGAYRKGIADFRAKKLALSYNGFNATASDVAGKSSNGAINLQAKNVLMRIGADKKQSAFEVTHLFGRFVGAAGSGSFSGGQGQIGNVPLLMSNAAGDWHFAKASLDIKAAATVADATPTPRFSPMRSDDFALRLINGKITGFGKIFEPATKAHVMDVSVSHDIERGVGAADIVVQNLAFGPSLQPEQLTPVTTGVIANVVGSVSGKGRINWSPTGVTSKGGFKTDGLRLVAAFGPVSGLKGEIALSSLLGLETPPGQFVSIAAINPGIVVTEGVVRYRLLPGLKVQIEGGSWPLAGGTLILDPTILDLSETAERRMTFRVENMDAARFLAQMEFENIAATGTLSGVLPMVFDKEGGRIEGGKLEADAGGGTLSYIGEVSRENLGTYGSIAFDALKSMKYRKLTIALNGALDGEMVSLIRFDGINQNPIVPGRAKLPLPIKVQGLTGIKFIFNINIKGPFRSLVSTVRSFDDPMTTVRDALEKERRRKEDENKKNEADKVVQPPESEIKP